mgnify:CR=1 FL=1
MVRNSVDGTMVYRNSAADKKSAGHEAMGQKAGGGVPHKSSHAPRGGVSPKSHSHSHEVLPRAGFAFFNHPCKGRKTDFSKSMGWGIGGRRGRAGRVWVRP